jgi:hypothetical protein
MLRYVLCIILIISTLVFWSHNPITRPPGESKTPSNEQAMKEERTKAPCEEIESLF